GAQLRRAAAQAEEHGLLHMMQLGFLAFEVSDLAAWQAFAVDVLGLELAARGHGFTLAMDGPKQRFFVTAGPADDLVAVGLEVAPPELDLLAARVRAAEADPTERDVARRFVVRDPAGVTVELVTGAARAARAQRFVADDLGLGHVVLSAAPGSHTFYT